jgi:integrase
MLIDLEENDFVRAAVLVVLGEMTGLLLKALSVRLGHENVATTMNLYQHIPVDMARESAQSVADYILG